MSHDTHPHGAAVTPPHDDTHAREVALRVDARPWLVAAALSLGAYVVYAAFHRSSMWWMIDLHVYRSGADAVLHGSRLYTLAYTDSLPFTYPPIAALAFVPMAVVPLSVAKWMIGVATLAALAWTCWVVARALGYVGPSQVRLAAGVFAVGLWLEPIQQTLSFGQINVILMALVLTDICARHDRRFRGVGVGVAAALKLTPAVFVLYYAITGQWRALRNSLLTLGALFVVPWLVMPTESRQFWLDRLFLDSKRVGGLAYAGNQSLRGVTERLTGGLSAELLWLVAAVAVAVCGMVVARRLRDEWDGLASALVMALVALLVSPISWSHHWVYVVPALAVGVHLAVTRRSRVVAALVAGGVLVFLAWPLRKTGSPLLPSGVIWLPASANDAELRWGFGQALLGDAEVLIGLVVFVSIAILCVFRSALQPSRHP